MIDDEYTYDPTPRYPDALLFVGGPWDGGWEHSDNPNRRGDEYTYDSGSTGFMRYQKCAETGEFLYVGDK